jgi:cytoskeleton protein RodZ
VNDQVNESVDTAEEADKTAGIGLLLRKAREARGLTVADVVTALKYSPRQIEALEADQMPLQAGNVFVRGIVRSYARFLKLDPEPLLALLESEAPAPEPDVAPPEDMGVAMPRSGGHEISGLVAAAILITILAAAIGVWHFLAPPLAKPGAVVVKNLPAATDQTPTATSSLVPPSTNEKTPTVVPVAPPELASPTEAHAEHAETAPAAPASAPAAAQSTSAPSKQLIFDFRGSSWVEVKDATQRVVFTGLYVGGTRQVARGQPPFEVVIGNAPSVGLTYEGHDVDLKPYTRADVARLTLE